MTDKVESVQTFGRKVSSLTRENEGGKAVAWLCGARLRAGMHVTTSMLHNLVSL